MTSQRPPISVIVPVHNRADLAAQCLAALERWTTPLEIVVVDDGSTEPDVEQLRAAGRARHWLRHPQALGFSAAVNRGLAIATGDPLVLLNSDAEVTQGGDRAILEHLAAPGHDPPGARRPLGDGFPGARRPPGAVAARLIYPNGRPQWSGGAFPTHSWLFALASGLGRGARSRLRRREPSGFFGGPVDWAPAAALAISREAYEAVGPLDEGYRHYAQDLDYCARLASAGRSVAVVPDWTVVHHLGGSVGALDSSQGGAASGYDGQRLDLLWLDLLRWAQLHRSAAWARRARRALLLGGRFRRLRLLLHRDSPEAVAVDAAISAISAISRPR
jgi:GT2 family glycosyltransferase